MLTATTGIAAESFTQLSDLAEQTYANLRGNYEAIGRARTLMQQTRKRLASCHSRTTAQARYTPFGEHLRQIISAAYELAPDAVTYDALDLDLLGVPVDDFVARIEQRHGWSAGTAIVYVGALRSALLGCEIGPTPWDDL